jgi:hypothetical protein
MSRLNTRNYQFGRLNFCCVLIALLGSVSFITLPHMVLAEAAATAPQSVHAENVAALNVLRRVLQQDLQLSRKSGATQLRAYIYAMYYIDVSQCSSRIQADWAAYLKACEKLDSAVRMAHYDPRLAMGLEGHVNFGTTQSSETTTSAETSNIHTTRQKWGLNARLWNLGGYYSHRRRTTSSSSTGQTEGRQSSNSIGTERGVTIAPEGNRWVNAMDAARDHRTFALARLSAAVLLACRADSPQLYMKALMVNYALSFMERQFHVSFDCAHKAARLGSVAAMCRLASLYRDGIGVKASYTKALMWYRKAAAAGNKRAMDHIGLLYYHGQGVPQDYTEAMAWFRKAENSGDAKVAAFAAKVIKAMQQAGN